MNTSPLRLPAGAGNRNPVVRTAFPDVSQELLDDKLDEYVRSIGVKAAFNLYNYQHMQAQQAEHVKSLYKLRPLLEHLLKVSRTGQIKYRFLKQSCLTLQQTFGSEVLQTHSESKDASLAPGLVADCLTVLLNHWRRVTSSEELPEVCPKAGRGSGADDVEALQAGDGGAVNLERHAQEEGAQAQRVGSLLGQHRLAIGACPRGL